MSSLDQYSTTKSKTILGFVGPQWEERIVADLDSALNNWMDSIPAHRKFKIAVLYTYTETVI